MSETPDLVAALRVINEAINLPWPASIDDYDTRSRLLDQRVLYASVAIDSMIQTLTGANPLQASNAEQMCWHGDYLRQEIDRHPVSYPTAERARAERDGGAS